MTRVTTTITAVDDDVADDHETILVTAMLAGAQIGDPQTITITDGHRAAAGGADGAGGDGRGRPGDVVLERAGE